VTVESRIAELGDRVNHIDQRVQAQARRSDSR
jgi:hypothetical protein